MQTQQEIDSYDIEEASKAKRTFNDQWQVKKAQESNLHGKVCRRKPLVISSNFNEQYASLGGEVSSQKSQLKTWESDLKEFKDINKRYTDQLIKVKVRALRFIYHVHL